MTESGTAKRQNLVVLAELKAVPGAIEQLLPLAEQHARNSLANEPGCLQFDVVRDGGNADKLLFYEVYSDEAAFEAHKAAPHLRWWHQKAGSLVAERRVTTHQRVAAPVKPKPAARKVLVAIVHLVNRPHLLRPLEEAGFELVLNPHGGLMNEAELIELLPGCVATIAGMEPYNERVLATAKDLKVIARLGVGYDAIDVAAATRHGVAVAMAFGTNHEPVADHAFALMAACAHGIAAYDRDIRAGSWKLLFHGRLTGAVTGIIGFGRIGRALAKRCQGFGMEVLVTDPVMDAETVRRLGCRLVSLDELLSRGDFVSVNAPMTRDTARMINAQRLALMKPSAFLINTARGGLVDEAALLEALRSRRIAGAGLDVFEAEPLPQDSPLRDLPNVIMTPHAAGASEWAIESMAIRTVDNIIAVCRGEDPGQGLLLNPEVVHAARR